MMVVAVQLAVASAVLIAPEVSHFPGSFFDTTARAHLQSRVMQSWPGPTALVEIWRTDDLDVETRVAILVGAPAYHDPVLLPVYREAIQSSSRRIRQAAAYGYHDLIGDLPPDVSGGVGDRAGLRLSREMDAIGRTLTRQTLVELWFQGLLQNERRTLPGFMGVAPRRPPRTCLMAIDRLMTVDDLDMLVQVYELTEERSTRIALMRLIEGLSLSRFVPRGSSSKRGWGPQAYDEALMSLDAAIAGWPRRGCTLDVDRVLLASLETMGVKISDPRSPESCQVWQWVLRGGDPGWWALASRRLYLCGGPWRPISVLQAEAEEAREQRKFLLKWYLLTAEDLARGTAKRGP